LRARAPEACILNLLWAPEAYWMRRKGMNSLFLFSRPASPLLQFLWVESFLYRMEKCFQRSGFLNHLETIKPASGDYLLCLGEARANERSVWKQVRSHHPRQDYIKKESI
jgi:hypothetical protein